MEKRNLENIKKLMSTVSTILCHRELDHVPQVILEEYKSIETNQDNISLVTALAHLKPRIFVSTIQAYIVGTEQFSIKEIIRDKGVGVLFDLGRRTYQYVGLDSAGVVTFREIGNNYLVNDLDLDKIATNIF